MPDPSQAVLKENNDRLWNIFESLKQTGQNSIAPESSLPQLGQVRWGSMLMVLTALSRNLNRK